MHVRHARVKKTTDYMDYMCYVHRTHIVVSNVYSTSFPHSLRFQYHVDYSIARHIQSKRTSQNRLPRPKMSPQLKSIPKISHILYMKKVWLKNIGNDF